MTGFEYAALARHRPQHRGDPVEFRDLDFPAKFLVPASPG